MTTANDPEIGFETARQAITAAYRADEASCVGALLAQWQLVQPAPAMVRRLATQLVEAVRAQRQNASGVDHLMQEFSLSSQEGVALMCLAEALLRIPDSATADRLIRDKISRGNWSAHLGGSSSLFVNAATWGLMITGKLVATHSAEGLGGALTRLIARSGEPVIRAGVDYAMRLLGHQFVMGETITAAEKHSRLNVTRGYTHSFDMLGEAALTMADADRYLQAYENAIRTVGQAASSLGESDEFSVPGISIKLSALHPRYVRSQRGRVMDELLARLLSLLKLAKSCGIAVNIDAEEADRLDLSLDLFDALAAHADLSGWNGLGFVVQAYQKRCPAVVDYLITLARRYQRRFPVRLVKGAYWDSEIKRAQVDGLAGYPVFTRKAHTDLCYFVCARKLLDAPDAVYPQFATHNAHTLATIHQLAMERGNPSYEFQCLHGMGEPLYDNVVGRNKLDIPCRIYAPVGSHETLLPYLVRRLLENGANSSFVNQLVDPAFSIDDLIKDPLDEVIRIGGVAHALIPLPNRIFTERRNSAGLDFSNEATLLRLAASLEQRQHLQWQAKPRLATPQKVGADDTAMARREVVQTNPAKRDDVVGTTLEADLADIEAALTAASAFAPGWHAVEVEQRAQALERAADLLESRQADLMSLCIREAGKSWPNAVAEIREAVDYCRYYAQQARQLPVIQGEPTPPGCVVCISPWNFPLAIFLGQISAALAAGSPVIAKPAEQTTLIADFAVELLHQAGVPFAALQLLPGRGEIVGAALVNDPRVRGVIFTGSTDVAQSINRSLASRTNGFPAPRLIAETGGQNAMIVDSTALLEQVVQDALVSGFDSAGQRCSALRLLCVQDDVADRLIGMLKAAMQELRIGNPAALSTDIGPVIDSEARAALVDHIERMRSSGAKIFELVLPTECRRGSFVAPTVIEINSVAQLEREVFGPVIHILRFAAEELDSLIADINKTGFGLTLGIHSRIDETVAQVIGSAHVGNIYVNRNIVGAVVGAQPFGGEGMSGTGPKAGGPLYLHRLREAAQVSAAELGTSVSLIQENDEPPPLKPLQSLAAWARSFGHPALASLCAAYAHSTLLDTRWLLPGPTGERNTLRFAPRGRILCIAKSAAEFWAQIAAVIATGNSALLCIESDQKLLDTTYCNWCSALPPDVRELIEAVNDSEIESAQIAAVLCAADDTSHLAWRQRLARRSGPLVPLISPQPDSTTVNTGYPLYRLLAERVVSVNTTAAGGNTALMTLGS